MFSLIGKRRSHRYADHSPNIRHFIVSIHRYNREEVVRSLGKEINLNPPLTLGQLPDTPEELLKLDQVSGNVMKWPLTLY